MIKHEKDETKRELHVGDRGQEGGGGVEGIGQV